MSTYRDILQEQGCLVTPIRGISMRPLLREKTDAVILEPVSLEDLKPLDVVMFERKPLENDAAVYILHRLVKVSGQACVALGDHNSSTEQVKPEWIIGRMTGFFRNGKRHSLQSFPYRLYLFFWCRPWKVRIRLLCLYRRVNGYLGRHDAGADG